MTHGTRVILELLPEPARTEAFRRAEAGCRDLTAYATSSPITFAMELAEEVGYFYDHYAKVMREVKR